MTDQGITQRQFVRDTVAAAAAAGLTATYTVHAGNPDKADTGKIVNYNSDMGTVRASRGIHASFAARWLAALHKITQHGRYFASPFPPRRISPVGKNQQQNVTSTKTG